MRRHGRGANNEDNDRPPRPPNAFILFRTAYNKANWTGERRQQKSVSREASERWNSMTAIEKAPWKAKAEERSLQHKLLYPDYKYCPKRRKRKVKSSGSRSPSEGPSNEPPRRRRRRRSPSLLPDTTSTISDPVAASTSSAARAPTHPALDAHSDATLMTLTRPTLSEAQEVGSWAFPQADVEVPGAPVANSSAPAVQEIRLPSVSLGRPAATRSRPRHADLLQLPLSPVGLEDPPPLSRLAHSTSGQALRDASSRLNATSLLLDGAPALDSEWQLPYVPWWHALPVIEPPESTNSHAQVYAAPQYSLETFPVDAPQVVCEPWMAGEQWSAFEMPVASCGYVAYTTSNEVESSEQYPFIQVHDWSGGTIFPSNSIP